MSEGIYKNYTTTSVLSGVDPEKFTAWSHLYFKEFILPHMPADRNAAILEIGCGYGRYTVLLTKDLGYVHTTGVDISEEQIEYAKNQYHLQNVYCRDAVEFLQQEQRNYDAVILMDVLEHLELEYAVKLLRLIHGSLNAGGKLIIQVPNGLSPLKPIFYGDVTHVRAFSVNSMSQILRMAGFTTFEHKSLPPLIHGIWSFLHRMIWSFIVHPLIYVFVTLSHGNPVGGIFSSNLLTIVRKDKA